MDEKLFGSHIFLDLLLLVPEELGFLEVAFSVVFMDSRYYPLRWILGGGVDP